MKRALPLISLVSVLLLAAAGSTFADDQSSQLAAQLTKEEQLLKGPGVTTATEVSKLKKLVETIRSTKDAKLISRGELLLTLFREQEGSNTVRMEEEKRIKAVAASIGAYRWHRTKGVLEKSGFWTGLSSLGLFAVSQAVSSWATDRYLSSSSAASATPYFITGQVSQIASLVGIIGTAGGIGMAWLLAINPFDIPAPPEVTSPASFPQNDMTVAEKISYLEKERKRYETKKRKAVGSRNVSFAFLAAGLTGLIATGIGGYLGNQAYLSPATSQTGSTGSSSSTTVYQYFTLGGAAAAFIGLTGASLGYLFGPDPHQVQSSIGVLDYELARLQSGQ